jgi:hypothetical protein
VRTKHPNPDPPSSQNYYSKKKELVLTFQMEDRKRNENLIYYSRKKNLDDEEQVSRIKPESNSKSSEVKTYHYSKGGFVQVLLSVGNSLSQNSSKTYYSRTRSFSQSAPSYVSRSESKEKEETRSYYSRARSVRGGR